MGWPCFQVNVALDGTYAIELLWRALEGETHHELVRNYDAGNRHLLSSRPSCSDREAVFEREFGIHEEERHA